MRACAGPRLGAAMMAWTTARTSSQKRTADLKQ
ncbi:SNX6 isoform 3 [Pan troglodytes]|uniref:SNX6 isoform 3 n=1 Tax=Pan troglodytes TaxID=9598 RepID=A0A2J8MHV9_PANTR|nr:SNX6 isoform 3 [Pan troglodytes]